MENGRKMRDAKVIFGTGRGGSLSCGEAGTRDLERWKLEPREIGIEISATLGAIFLNPCESPILIHTTVSTLYNCLSTNGVVPKLYLVKKLSVLLILPWWQPIALLLIRPSQPSH